MEIERKFLVHTTNFDLIRPNEFEIATISQTYLSFQPEIRIRCVVETGASGYRETYTLTVKSDGDKTREEAKLPITENMYYSTLQQTKNKTIHKIRKKYLLDTGFVAEVDEYADFEFKTVEVEFKNEKEADTFIPPSWFGEEVTNDKTYKNKNLAQQLGKKYDVTNIPIGENTNSLYAVQYTLPNAALNEDYQFLAQTYVSVCRTEEEMLKELKRIKQHGIYCNFVLWELEKHKYI